MIPKPVLAIFFIVLLVSIGAAGYYFWSGQPGKPLVLTGIIRPANLESPAKDYCPAGFYLDSLNENPLTGSDSSLLIKLTSASNLTRTELSAGMNQVYDVTGIYKKGAACSSKNSCACDNFFEVQNIKLNDAKYTAFIKSVPRYEGIIKCLYPEGETSCIPVITTSNGKRYRIADPAGTYQLDDGARVRIWVSGFDPVADLPGENVAGTIYAGAAQPIP